MMSTCNRLDSETLGYRLVMPKNLPEHWWNLTLRLHITTFSFAYFPSTHPPIYIWVSIKISCKRLEVESHYTYALGHTSSMCGVRSTTWSCCANSDLSDQELQQHRKLRMSSSSCLMWVHTESQQVSPCNSRVLARLTTSFTNWDSHIHTGCIVCDRDSLVLAKSLTLMICLEQIYQTYMQNLPITLRLAEREHCRSFQSWCLGIIWIHVVG